MSNAIDGGMLVPEPAMVQMFPSGTYVDLLDPHPDTIQADDIAHHTGMTVRYGGGVRRFYSVAEHASLVGDLLEHQGHPPSVVLAGLLHDAAEAYVGDLVSPLKYALRLVEAEARGLAGSFQRDNGAWFAKPPRDLRGVYSNVSDRIESAIGACFGLDPDLFDHPDVKLADMWALKVEAKALTFSGGACWRWPGTLPYNGQLPSNVTWEGGLPPESAASRWLARFVHWTRA